MRNPASDCFIHDWHPGDMIQGPGGPVRIAHIGETYVVVELLNSSPPVGHIFNLGFDLSGWVKVSPPRYTVESFDIDDRECHVFENGNRLFVAEWIERIPQGMTPQEANRLLIRIAEYAKRRLELESEERARGSKK